MKKKTTLVIVLFIVAITGNTQTFQWAKSIGGTEMDVVKSIAVDSSGNVYTTGYFEGTADFDPGLGTSNLTSAGINAIFISKLDASGNFLWARSFSGTGSGRSMSIAVDGYGNVYTTGYYWGTVDFDPGAGSSVLTNAGDLDVFISKLDTDGNFLWVKGMGGSDRDEGASIAVDGTGNVYATGFFKGTADFDPGVGTSNLTSQGGSDIFISKLDTDGNFLWAKGIGGSDWDGGTSIAVDGSGNVHAAGSFRETVDFDPGAGTSNLTSAGDIDIFISKLDASGNYLWAKSMSGDSIEVVRSIAIDGSGNVYTTGNFYKTTDFDPGVEISNLTSTGRIDIFISKLDAFGNFLWAKGIGGSDYDHGFSIAVDGNGNVHATGDFRDTVEFDPEVGISNLTSAGGRDIIILKLDASGNILWAKGIGGSSWDQGFAIAVNGSRNIYMAGEFWGALDIDLGAETSTLTCAGRADIFILKYDQCSPLDLTTSISGVTISSNNTGASYQWLDCDSNNAMIQGETGQSFTATVNGSFAVELTENGCVDTSVCVTITTVGILESNFESTLTVYPNPTNGEMSIDLGEDYNHVMVIIRDQLGQDVLKKSFKGSSLLRLNIPGEAGMYSIELSSGDKKAILHVVKT